MKGGDVRSGNTMMLRQMQAQLDRMEKDIQDILKVLWHERGFGGGPKIPEWLTASAQPPLMTKEERRRKHDEEEDVDSGAGNGNDG